MRSCTRWRNAFGVQRASAPETREPARGRPRGKRGEPWSYSRTLPPPPPLLAPFLSMRDLRGPDLALERDHEDRPNERGNTCPAPTGLRRTQGLEDPAPHEAPAETEDDVPEQPVPSALHGDPGQPAGHQSDENRRPEHFEMHDSFSLTGCSGSLPAISLDLLLISLYKLYIKYKLYNAGRSGHSQRMASKNATARQRRAGVSGSRPAAYGRVSIRAPDRWLRRPG